MYRKNELYSYLVSLIIVATLFVPVAIGKNEPATSCKPTDPFCYSAGLKSVPAKLEAVTVPKIATPAWLSAQGAQASTSMPREVSYQVAAKGSVSSNMDEFASQVNSTLNSPEGWSRLGIRFVRVDSGGQFTVWLSESSQVPSFSPSGCDAIVSCTVGNNVIINEARWIGGSDAWNGAGGSLSDYRHMVVNHETGHWLGHGHEYCAGDGHAAPVMQQQTIDMQGCKPNPWPQQQELYAPRLGIRS